MKKAALIILIGITIFLGGCATRSEINKFKVQLDYLESSNARHQRDIARLDSMMVEQQKILRSMKAEQNINLSQLDTDMKIILSILDESGFRVSKLDQRIEDLRREIVYTPDGDTLTDSTSTYAVDMRQIYDTAYLDHKRGNYTMALMGYRQFVDEADAEKSDLIDDAFYGIAECLYSLDSLDQSASTFQQLIDNHPKSDKVVSSLYKRGIIFQQQGKVDHAEIVFNNIVKDYPHTPEAGLAKDRLEALKE